MNLQEFILSINGYATLLADDNQSTFLGLVSSNSGDINSICNPNGQYGSSHGFESIRNHNSLYGFNCGPYSPYNPHCFHPPVIVYQGRIVLRVTKNQFYMPPERVPKIDPDVLFGILFSVGGYAAQNLYQNVVSSTPQYFHTGAPVYNQAPSQPTWEDLYNTGNHFLNSQQYEQALTAYQQVVQLNPNFSDAWLNAGVALANLKRYEEAIDVFNKAVQINPNDSLVWSNKGFALLNLKRYEEAIDAYNQATKTKPNYSLAWSNKGFALSELQRFEEAITAFDQALQMNDDWGSVSLANAWSSRGDALLQLQRFEEAITSYDKALKLDPNLLGCWYCRANILFNLKRYEEAIPSYNKATQVNPDLFDIWYKLGLSLFNLKQYTEAIAAFVSPALRSSPRRRRNGRLRHEGGFLHSCRRGPFVADHGRVIGVVV